MEAYHRSLHPEPVGGSDSFSLKDFSDGSSGGARERLDSLHGSEGCIPSDPDPPCQQQVPQVCNQGAGPDNFRFVSGCSLCLRCSLMSCHLFWLPPLLVFRRGVYSGVVSGGSTLGEESSSQLVPGAENLSHFGDINSASISTDCLFGNQDQLADLRGFDSSLGDRRVLLYSRRISVLVGAVSKVFEGSVVPPRVSVTPCLEWLASLESLATGSIARLEFSC